MLIGVVCSTHEYMKGRMSEMMMIVWCVEELGCDVGEDCKQPGVRDKGRSTSNLGRYDVLSCKKYRVCEIFVSRRVVPTLVRRGEMCVLCDDMLHCRKLLLDVGWLRGPDQWKERQSRR